MDARSNRKAISVAFGVTLCLLSTGAKAQPAAEQRAPGAGAEPAAEQAPTPGTPSIDGPGPEASAGAPSIDGPGPEASTDASSINGPGPEASTDASSTAEAKSPAQSPATEEGTAPDTEPALPEAADRTAPGGGAPLPANVPVDEEGVFLGKDHTGTPDKPALVSKPPPQSQVWNERYDGRPDGPVSSEQMLIWIPRALLFPVYLALEYLVRKPVVGLVTLAEEHYLFERVVDFFTFADGDAAIYPSALYDAGRGFWAAGNFFYKNAWVEGHTIDAFAGYGTSGWYELTLGDSWTVFDNDTGRLSFTGTFGEDPTLTFTGLGPRTDIDDEVFFAERKGEVEARLRVAFPGLNRFGIRTGFRNARLSGGRRPSIDAAGSPFDPAGLPVFEDDFNLLFGGLLFELDSRDPERDFSPGSGLRLQGFGDFYLGVDDSRLRFFRYGTRPAAFWDISRTNHVLVLSLYAEAVSRVGGEPVPISELVVLGGEDYLRGFVLGRFRGESALVHSLTYTWPVLIFLDGILFTELGNVFEGFYRDFSYDKMVLDWGFGLRTNLSREYGFNLLLAFGSNQIEQWNDGFAVDNLRFSVGATRAF